MFTLVNPRGMEREVVRSVGADVRIGPHERRVRSVDLKTRYFVLDVSEIAWVSAKLNG